MTKLEAILFASLSEVIEFRDVINDAHITRTKKYIELMIRALTKVSGPYKKEVSRWNIRDHSTASQLHDIGKIGVPDNILRKMDRLSEPEFEIAKEHVSIGVNIIDHLLEKLNNNKQLLIARNYTISHHEYWDGTGYPYGISKTDIPLEGRIMAIVDTYDTLRSKRAYKDPIPHMETCKIIRDDSGIKFDPELIRIFFLISDRFEDTVKESK